MRIKLNTIIGWVVFCISLIIYTITLEPTVSFWDCGEFIASSYKLQVGHPPGAPFFQIFQRIFSLLAPNTGIVAFMMNFFSAVASAATVMFLYLTIVLLAQRFSNEKNKNDEPFLIYAAGIIGSLTFAFTDTFWFSAVEAEVYAFSSLFTAIVFWAILKWERESFLPNANRWIVLIAYLIGLSIGVHLLNLLAIPAISLIWYFKKYQPTVKGIVITLLSSALMIILIMYGIVQGTPRIAEIFDVFFVNTLGLPLNSGLLFFVVFLGAIFAILIIYSHKTKKVLLNLAIVSMAVIYIGFSSYTMIIIRAQSNPPMNENDPSNAYALMNYLNRTQYGSTPIFSGYYYNAPAVSLKQGKPVFYPNNNKYIVIDGQTEYEFDDRFKTIFPRMYSQQDNHVYGYKKWGKVNEQKVNINGQTEVKPTFTENLRYFFSYQLNHMYIRYFMWNFSGRQNDIQGHGDIFNGNWLSGIGFIDKARLGHNGFQPSAMSNPDTTNRYFMLPFLLGLIGLFFHYRNNKNDFWVVMLLFFMTGIAIVLFLNQPPYQPRERDYAYAGSFYTFAIWIGFGVIGVSQTFEKVLKNKAKFLAIIGCAIVPIIVLSQNYDDHNRSGRYIVRDLGKNYLNSCEKNAILFTYGDNDTFPLWYVQDVENERPDVRICNVTLLNSDWYIDQMKRKVYESDPVPISMEREKYMYNVRNTVIIRDDIKTYVELKTLVNIVLSENTRTKVKTQAGRSFDFLPSRNVKITVDKEQVLLTNTVPANKASIIEDSIYFTIQGNYLSKSDLAILDMLANNNWERPIYFDLSVVQTSNLKLEKYLQNEGFAYRFVPIKSNSLDSSFDTDILYSRLIEQFSWGNIGSCKIHIDNNMHRTTEIVRLKNNFLLLASALIDKGQNEKALNVINKIYEIMPLNSYYTSFNDVALAKAYNQVNANKKAEKVLSQVAENSLDKILFYLSLGSNYIHFYEREMKVELSIVREVLSLSQSMELFDLYEKIRTQLDVAISKK